MADSSNEVIDGLADELGIPRSVMRTALKNFRDRDISDFSDEEEAMLRDTVRKNIRQVLAQRGGLKGFAGITPDVVRPALMSSRRQILADQAVGDKVKAFIQDHCVC